MIGYLVVSILPLIGVIAGLGRVISRRVPFIVAGLVLVAFLLYLAAAGVWAASCGGCYYQETSRAEVFAVGAYLLGFLTLTTLLGVWLGARLVTILGRLRRTWREIRGEPPATGSRGV